MSEPITWADALALLGILAAFVLAGLACFVTLSEVADSFEQ